MNAAPPVTRQPAVPLPWKRHGSTTLLDTGSYLIHRDSVSLPDGTAGYFEFHQARVDAALTVAMDEQGRIAMVRYRSYVHGEVITPPGGKLDVGEDPLEGARRELKEESGITAEEWSPLGRIALMTKSTAHLYMYLARDLRVGEQELTATETGMTVEWWPLQESVAAAMDGRLLLSGAVVSVLMAAQAVGAAGRV
ncbi:NUDIX domain-containing protein [Streptacidiphilus jiangxiensis]|uniref:ADP-ribose pyrophosphatase n=1 Tax=Streptacidiphilus jiangxiensis TaxID=235985 RepID=A0A1H8BR71_STRJI|nr:NUDIX hydrolase [Streptacidiphilus jiangxiensis]SEM85381.1 ADP-ribose pyrophosphatase [Streptacidiphilus jiangxiensis]